MDRRALIELAERDWGAPEALDAAFWRERKRKLGAEEGLRIGDELRRHVQLVRPGELDDFRVGRVAGLTHDRPVLGRVSRGEAADPHWLGASQRRPYLPIRPRQSSRGVVNDSL